MPILDERILQSFPLVVATDISLHFLLFSFEERLLPVFIETFGDHKLIWASDYPHERDRTAFLHDLPRFFERKDYLMKPGA